MTWTQRHSGRRVSGSLLIRWLAGWLAVGGVLLGAAPARAADLFISVNPSTVPAGSQVSIQASCDSNTMPATAESPAFDGTVNLQPQNGLLTGAAMVPATTPPDMYRVTLRCSDGRTSSTRLDVVAATQPSRGPATGFGGTADDPQNFLLTGGIATVVAGMVLGLSAYRRRVRRPTRAVRVRVRR